MINVVFFGTPTFAKHFLESLQRDGEIFVSAVVAQPDKPVGRKKILTAPPTKEFALEHDIPVLQPAKLRDEAFQKQLTDLKPDLFVIVAYGKIIPEEVLTIPARGAINVHPSLLPKYRGPSPVQSAIAAQEKETGVSIMLIDKEMDHGPILAQERMVIDATDDTESLLEKAASISAPLLLDSIKRYMDGSLTPSEQDHAAATFCKLIDKEDGKVDWNESAEAIEAKSRAYRPWPGIFTTWNGKMLKLLSVLPLTKGELEGVSLAPGKVRVQNARILIGTSTSPIEVLEIQPEGKASMTASAFLNGNKEIDHQMLGK